MNKQFKGKIINALRRLSFTYSPRNNAKSRQKVGPATFACEHCNIWIYEGSRNIDTQLDKLELKPPNGIIKGKTNMDHKEPVVPLESFKRGSWDWDQFINRMFCEESGYQLLCSSCHKVKTQKEDEIRKNIRQNKLTNK